MTTKTDTRGPIDAVPVGETPSRRITGWIELVLPTLAEIRERCPVAQPILTGWLLSILTAWLAVPIVGLALGGDTAGSAEVVQGWIWAIAALSPLVQGGRALMWVGACWALLALAGREQSKRRLFSLFLYGELLLLAYGLGLALYFQWAAGPGGAGVRFTDPLSLSHYVPSDHGIWGGVVKHLSVVQLGWVAYLGVAGTRVLGLGRRGAWSLALILWFGLIAVATARILITG